MIGRMTTRSDGRTLTVLSPGTAAYESARRPAIGNFHDLRPSSIVACRDGGDVAEALALARDAGLSLAVRSGGHCFAGRSSTDGVLVDVAPIDSITVGDGVVTVGAGARLGAIYDALEPHGLALAAGCGSSVGISGLVLGGGLGILGRRHGLTCDQLVSARVVLADGREVGCDEQEHADLFWALRGAGGSQFGVLTELRLRTVPAPTITTLHARWPMSDGVAVLAAWQRWGPSGPPELAASLLVKVGPDLRSEPEVHVFGALLGGRDATAGHIDELVVAAGAQPTSVSLHEESFRRAKALLAAEAPGDEPPADAYTFSRSEFFRRPLPQSAIVALLEHLTAHRRPGESRTLDFSPWGGAYNEVAETATAFAHRDERFLLKHDVVVAREAIAAHRREARDWLAGSWQRVRPWGSGRVYPNFPDPALENGLAAYHAGNLDRLLRVKAKYDPAGVFRFQDSLPATASRSA